MGILYNLKVSIEEKIKADGLDGAQIRGKLGLRTGRLISLISPSTPDDPATIVKFASSGKFVGGFGL